MTNITDLSPKHLWDNFYKLTQIPRASKKEAQVLEFLKSIFTEKKIAFFQDKAGNIVAKVNASPGLENAKATLLQAHVDMVTEKYAELNFDFNKDPIPAFVDGEYIRTKGTTLGADNGVGVAMMLALLSEKELKHGPLELLFTIDEETGLTGASNLDPTHITAKYMLNLDSEDEGEFCIGCAGGLQFDSTLPLEKEKIAPSSIFEIKIEGLFGGHSGIEIHKNRGNAIKILGFVLKRLSCDVQFQLIDFSGGTKHNAIPRDAKAKITIKDGKISQTNITELLAIITTTLKQHYAQNDPNLKITIDKLATQSEQAFTLISTHSLIAYINALPHGILSMLNSVPVVETSTNLAIANIVDSELKLLMSIRSAANMAKNIVAEQVQSIADLAKASCNFSGDYTAWQPNSDSFLLKKAKEAWKNSYKQDSKVVVIHAGLECGIIMDKCKNLEAISFGPNMHHVHTPKEELHIESTKRVYEFTKILLSELAKT